MPYSKDVATDDRLSTFAAGYDPGDMIADQACPVIETAKSSGTYTTYKRENVETQVDDLVAEKGQAKEVGYETETGEFDVKHRALKALVPETAQRSAGDAEDPYEWATKTVMHKLLLAREIRVADLYDTAGSYASGNTAAVGTAWTSSSATPIADIDAMKDACAPGMLEATKTVLILAKPTWHLLRRHPNVLAGGALSAVLSVEQAKDLFGVDEILISDARKITSNRGQSTITRAYVWNSANAFLARLPIAEPTRMAGLFCGTFRQNLGDGPNVSVTRWFDPDMGLKGGEVVKPGFSDDEVAVQNDMAYRLTGVNP